MFASTVKGTLDFDRAGICYEIPLTPDGYVIRFCENGMDFSFLHFTEQLVYTHEYVALYSSQMFYNVIAVKNYSPQQLVYRRELNNSKQKIMWDDVLLNLEQIETYQEDAKQFTR